MAVGCSYFAPENPLIINSALCQGKHYRGYKVVRITNQRVKIVYCYCIFNAETEIRQKKLN